jgi:hypothetical protein
MKFLQQLRLIFVLFAIFRPEYGHAQILWEDFQLPNGSNLPTQWIGDRAKFEVKESSLVSNSSTTNDVFYVEHAIHLKDSTEWEFDVDLNINTSSVNKIRIYLVQDSSQSVYLEIGGTRDRISVFVANGALQDSLLWHGPSGETHKFQSVVRIRRVGQLFKLSYFNKEVMNYDEVGQWNWSLDSDNPKIRWEVYQSTASFFYKHKLNSVYVGPWRIDNQHPIVQDVAWVSNDTFVAHFSEGIYSTPAAVIRVGSQNASYKITGKAMKFWFDGQLLSGKHDVLISGFTDNVGNTQSDTIFSVSYWETEPTQLKDVVISEWMSDPSPSVGLPEVEYIELYNRGGRHVDLTDWTLSDSRETAVLPSRVLPVDSFVVLVDFKDSSLTNRWPNVVHVNLPALNNGLDYLQLVNSDQVLIDDVAYDIENYTPEWKRDGGFSLERVDVNFDCDHPNLFAFSNNVLGGSPGVTNSHNLRLLDTVAPFVVGVFVSKDSLVLSFSEKIEDVNAFQESIAELNNFHPLKSSDVKLVFAWVDPPEIGKKFEVILPATLDCAGNRSVDTSFYVALPATPQAGDILVSEILYDGYQDLEFVEVVNVSKKTIQLSDLRLGRMLGDKWQLTNPIQVDRLVHPGEVVALTNDKNLLVDEYHKTLKENVVELSSWMTLPNDGALIGLFNKSGQSIDTVTYDDDHHHELLAQTKGVSLERRRLDLTYVESERNFWTSSSSLDDFATPGFHRVRSSNPADYFTLVSDPVSPNGDGIADDVTIQVNGLPIGTVGRFAITDLSGNPVFKGLDQELFSDGRAFIWHVVESQVPVAPGIYVINVQYLTLTGERGSWRKLVTVVLDD